MTIKIENVKLKRNDCRNSGAFKEWIQAVGALKVGQSFMSPITITSNQRNALSVCNYLLDRQFTCQKVNGKFRVGRIS